MGCCGGFGGSGGGGGGTGNLNGTLTAGVVPVADAPHNLVDSPLLMDGVAPFVRAVMNGAIRVESDVSIDNQLVRAGGAGMVLNWLKSRGTLAALTSVAPGDILGTIGFAGYDGASYSGGVSLVVSVDGSVGTGVIPGRVELNVDDAAGNPATVWTADSNKQFSVPYKLVIGKVTRNTIASLTVSVGVVAIDANDSDWFDLDLSAPATLAAPTNPEPGARLFIRVRNTGSTTLAYNAVYRFSGNVAPVVTVGKTSYLGFVYNEVDNKWDEVGEKLNFG